MAAVDTILALANAGRWSDVLERLEDVGPLDGTVDVDVRRLRVRALRLLNRRDEALEEARGVVRDAEALDHKVWAALQEMSWCVRDHREAVRLMRRAVADVDRGELLAPRVQLRFRLGRRLVEVGDRPGAEALLDEALQIDPGAADDPDHALLRSRLASDAEVRTQWLGRGLGQAEGVARAQLLYELASTLLDTDPQTALELAREALDTVAGIDAVLQTRTILHALVGQCQAALGNIDAAEASFEVALDEARASHDVANEQLFVLARGLRRLRAGDLDAAREDFEAVHGQARRALLEHFTRLGLAAHTALVGDAEAFQEHAQPYLFGSLDELPVQPSLAELATHAARGAEQHGWLDDAAGLRRVALELGEPSQEPVLRRLAAAGARTPLGPFRLSQPLASGSFGQVWLAHAPSGHPVAIKVLQGGPQRGGWQLDNELRAVATLDHPNIVRLLDAGRIDRTAVTMNPALSEGSTWLALELASGGTLGSHLGSLPFPAIRRVLVGLLDALAHAHARGVLHLDIKPSNVLIRDGQPLLADFGLARLGDQEWRPAGTPEFMAPEQFQRDASLLGPWTDLYAVGCVGVALVSGVPPFGSTSTLRELRDAHRSRDPEVAPKVPMPRGFLAWVLRIMAKRGEDRFPCAADAARALQAVDLGGTLDTADPAGPVAELSTVVLPALDDLGPVPALPADGAMPLPEPFVPLSFKRPDPRNPIERDEGGTGLFSVRAMPFVGRVRERALLWATLRDVFVRREPRSVVVESAPGLGATALVAWLAERSRELGAATVVTDVDALHDLGLAGRPALVWLDEPTPDELEAAMVVLDRPAPWLLVASGAPGVADRLLDRDAVPLSLGPLSDAVLLELAGRMLPLEARTAARIVACAQGSPGTLRHLVADLVQRSRLRRAPEGWVPRGDLEHEVPSDLDVLWDRRVASVCVGDPTARGALLAYVSSGTPLPEVLAGRLLDAGLAREHGTTLRLDPAIRRFLTF